jgi:cysteine desulfurase
VGFAAAVQQAMLDRNERNLRIAVLRNQLWAGIHKRIPRAILNGNSESRLSHNLNITFPGISGSDLHRTLRPDLACSSGSACSEGIPSHVLQAIGRSRSESEASLRMSLGRSTTIEEVKQAIELISRAVTTCKRDL